MNRLGAARTPFFFAFDYDLDEPIIHPLSELPPEIRLVTPSVSVRAQPAVDRRPTGSGGAAGEGDRAHGGTAAPVRITSVEPVAFARYRQGFETVQKAQRAGDSYLANLTFASRITIDGDLDSVFENAHAPYRLKVGERFVVFSPEPFVTISGSAISTFPMKGTRETAPWRPGLAHAAKELLALEALLADEKEAAEHATVVDLLRNDIGRVASEVRVPRYRYVDRLRFPERTLFAVSSAIEGTLDDEWRRRLGSIFEQMLPAGSITGAPKESTCRIIAEAELDPRGFYTGVFGVFDGMSVESAVMIRFIESSSDGYRFRSGGGITVYSDCEREYRELIDKVAIPWRPPDAA